MIVRNIIELHVTSQLLDRWMGTIKRAVDLRCIEPRGNWITLLGRGGYAYSVDQRVFAWKRG